MSKLYLARVKDPKTQNGTIMQVVQPHESDYFRFFQVVDVEEIDCSTSWFGPKIKLIQWRELMAFFESAYHKHRSEQQARIYFNKKANEFKFWVYPQKSSGMMATSEIEDHPQRKIQEVEIGNDFMLWGTVHHHCSSNAYQSSIDTANEGPGGSQGVGWAGQGGLHVTVGHIGGKEYDLHGRVVLRGAQSDVVWSQWFEPPEGSEEAVTDMLAKVESLRKWKGLFPNLPELSKVELMEKLVKASICEPPAEGTTYPTVWMDNVISFFASRDASGSDWQGRTTIPVGSSHKPMADPSRHYHMDYIGAKEPEAPSFIPTAQEQQVIDYLFAIGDRYRTVAYRAIGLLRNAAGLDKGFQPHDNDDQMYLASALPYIEKSPLSMHRVITAMENSLEAEIQGYWNQ